MGCSLHWRPKRSGRSGSRSGGARAWEPVRASPRQARIAPTSSAAQVRQATPTSPTVKSPNWGEPIGLPRLVEPRPGWSLGSRRRLEPSLVIHAGIAPWHSGRSWLQRSVLPCPGGQGRGMVATLAASGTPRGSRGPSGAAAADDLLTGTIRSRRKLWAVSGSASAAAAGGQWWPPRSRCRSGQPRPATRTPGPRSHLPYPTPGPRGSRPRCRRPPGPRVAARPTPIRRPACAEPARRGGTSSRAGSRRDERTLVGQAGHGHVQELAVGQGACPDRELGASGLALTIRTARSRSRRAHTRPRTARLTRPTSSS
jgi:hypothetical protein